jgi:HEAT repeat protein
MSEPIERGRQKWREFRDWGDRRDAAHVDELIKAISSPDDDFPESESLRRVATWALGRMGFDALAQHRELAASPNSWLRAGYAEALGETRDARAAGLLANLALDADREVALWAALSLAKIGEDAIPAIRRCLNERLDFFHDAQLVDALRQIASTKAREELVTHLERVSEDRRSELVKLLELRSSDPPAAREVRDPREPVAGN